jgi:hypothetical protein
MMLGMLMISLTTSWLVAQQASHPQERRNPSVGAGGDILQIVLPGTELVAKPLVEGTPIVIRITNVFPHGDRFRYDIRFHGLEPGKFNLADWLERKDGSTTDNLPEIEVEIQSLLPAGQIQPNELESGLLPRLGGYRNVAILLALLWTLVLFGLIFLGRKKSRADAQPEKELSLAELLKARIETAMENRMDSSQYAELERMLFGFWRKRLGLTSVSAAQALATIKQDENAGPLMIQLEQWMHNPAASRDVDLGQLLAPFHDLPAETPGFDEEAFNVSKTPEVES